MNQPSCFRCSIFIAVVMVFSITTEAKDKHEQFVVERVYDYSSTVHNTDSATSLTYLKYQLTTRKRNSIMYAVPRLYNIARGERRYFFCEHIMRQIFYKDAENEMENIARVSTVRRRHKLFPNLQNYLTPQIYNPTILDNQALSPFNRLNRRYYKYNIIYLSDSVAQIEFLPRAQNTQTVKGQAIVDIPTGRIVSCYLEGEYDLVSYELKIELGDEGAESLFPKHSELYTRFTFLGNEVDIRYDATYFLPDSPDYTPIDDEDKEREFVEHLRPTPLTPVEAKLLADYDSVQTARRNAPPSVRKKDFAKDVLWDIFGENMLHRIRGHFGANGNGYYRLSPILNPLYFSFSGRRGLTYRLKGSLSYDISPNKEIELETKIGYSFKLQQLFVELPATFTFSKKHNGFLRFVYKDGNQITNSTVIEMLQEEQGDSIDWDSFDLDYFNHRQFDFTARYEFTPHFGAEAGILRNRWTAIAGESFRATERPQVYESTSFYTELSIRPLGWKGPVITVDYERTINGLSKDYMNYERWEYDFSYLKNLPAMKSFSFRIGGGFYSSHTSGIYFLDYRNFKENNLPGGWNDEWTGEFELLHRNYYNSSKYYFRMNATYESPMLLMSWVPVIGHAFEKERIYFSALHATKLNNYMELGYGFTNRLFSMGCFMSLKNGRYDGFGCKVGFELFNGW